MHFEDFSLRDSCNLVINEVVKSTGLANIIKVSMDIEVPDRLKGNANAFEERLKRVTHWLSKSLINGVVSIELKCRVKTGNNVTLQVNGTARDSGGGLQNLDPQFDFFEAHVRGRLLQSAQQLGLPPMHRLQCTIDTNIIRVTYSESFFYQARMKERPQSAFEQKKVLLVEDNEINAMVFLSFMEDWGIDTTQARNGQEAVRLSKERKFDLVLMDIHMPIMNGIEATRALRALDANTRIVALTASSLHEDMRDAFHAGVCGYLHKPVTNAQLFEALRQHMT